MSERRQQIVELTMKQIGCKYHDHALVPNFAYDCATMPWHIYSSVGIIPPPKDDKVPYYSPQQWLHRLDTQYKDTIAAVGGRKIEEKDAQVGDLVLFFIRTKLGGSWTHGGILVQMNPQLIVHPLKKLGVILSDLNEGFWKGYRREYYSFLPEGE